MEAMTRTREYHRCPSCGERRHELLFPWSNPDASKYPRPPRSETPKALREFEKRSVALADVRRLAQAEGRDFSSCLPCRNGDA